MPKPYKQFIAGLLSGALLLAAGPVRSQPWRLIEPLQATRIVWQGLTGHVGGDKTRVYSISSRGAIPLFGEASKEQRARLEEYIIAFLLEHPEARAIPVEAYPFFSNSVARIYVWVVSGKENLNLQLVQEGFLRANSMLPLLRTADLLVSAREMSDFRKKIAAAEIAAAQAGKGLWAHTEIDPDFPPGALEYPSLMELAELEHLAETAPLDK